MNRRAIVRLYLLGLGALTLFWWPLSHWFYPDWYHRLLGFEGYDCALMKVIGYDRYVAGPGHDLRGR